LNKSFIRAKPSCFEKVFTICIGMARQGMPSLPSILRRRFILKSGKQIMKEYRKTYYEFCGDDTAAIIIPEEFILVRLINTEIKKALSMKFRPR